MADKILSGVVLNTKRYYWKGVLQYVQRQDVPSYGVQSAIVSSTKTSVNTGKFSPNVFRINPYSVMRESAHVAGSGTIIGRKQVDASSMYEYEYTGPIAGTCFSNRYCWKVPIFSQDQELQRLADVCLQKAYSKVGSPDFGGLENLGELRETLELLRNPFKALRDFLAFKNPKLGGASNGTLLGCLLNPKSSRSQAILASTKLTGNVVAKTWLEVRYGLRPLVSAVQDVIKLVDKVVNSFDANRVRSKRSKLKIDRHTASTETGGANGVVLMSGKCICHHKIKICGIVYFKQKTDLSQAQKLGLDLRYLPEAIWELTRLSFVVDWLFTIGPWLGSLRFQPEILYLGATTSCKIDSFGSITLNPRSATGVEFGTLYKMTGDSTEVKFEGQRFDRVVKGTQPPSLPLFRGTSGLDFWKVLDGLALINQSMSFNIRR